MAQSLTMDYCIKNTQILAEGDKMIFWSLHQHNDPNTMYNSNNWKSTNQDHFCTVGRINDRPINIILHWYEIDGVIVCVYDGISQLVDWKMIENYLKEKFPDAKMIINARSNYHNIFHHITRINNKKKPNEEPDKKKRKY